jgi:hypothetical protein
MSILVLVLVVVVVVASGAASSIVLSSLSGVAFTFTAFVKKACVAVVNTETYVPIFFIITFDDDVVAWIVYAVDPLYMLPTTSVNVEGTFETVIVFVVS